MTNTALRSADNSTKLTTLRAELKQWEKTFADANDGRKAGRKDIKQDPIIAAKYKAYGRLRALESNPTGGNKNYTDKSAPEPQSQQPSAKRKHSSKEDTIFTPQKLLKQGFSTPSKTHVLDVHPSQFDPYDSPSTLRRLFSPVKDRQGHPSPLPLKSAIGPTPQRDGKALGIFDLLSNPGSRIATPSTKRVSNTPSKIMQTPSKNMNVLVIPEEGEETETVGRTPESSSKRLYLERLFATPTTLRYAAMVEDGEDDIRAKTVHHVDTNANPSATTESGTPLFLRRSNSGLTLNPTHGSTELSPIALRKPHLFAGRGLSALVKGLRDLEDERIQDDIEALREIEVQQEIAAATEENYLQMGDSQAPTDVSGRPWKKRGQKRTTRRIQMKPLPPKPKPNVHAEITDGTKGGDEATIATGSMVAIVEPEIEETTGDEGGQEDSIHRDDDSLSLCMPSNPDPGPELDPDYKGEGESDTAKRSIRLSEKIKAAFSVVKNVKLGHNKAAKTTPTSVEASVAERVTSRRIDPQAHANYRSLKIKNKRSRMRITAGRFGRRR